MAMRKSSRNYIHKKFDDLLPEPERIEGFVPIIPKRKEFVGDLQKIIEANEGSSRANSKSCWVPFDEEYKAHRCELSDALRAETEKQFGGYFQPMSGKDLVVDLMVVLPAKPDRHRYFPWDVDTTFADAAKFNAWTTDNKRLGLFGEYVPVQGISVSRRESTGDDDPSGIHFVVRHADASDDAKAPKMSIEKEIALMSACMADEHTPLHPAVLNYFRALRSRYSTDTARRLAVFEQSRLDVATMFDGEPEAIIAEIDERAKRLLEASEKCVSIAFCVDNH